MRKIEVYKFEDNSYGVSINGVIVSEHFMDYEAKAQVEQLLTISDDLYKLILLKKGLS